MTLQFSRLLAIVLATAALPVFAQNLAVVNGKPVPSTRVELMIKQMATQGQQDSPQLREMVKQQLINNEILIQEANKLGLGSTPEVKNQIDLARDAIVIRALVNDFVKKHPVSDAEIKTEYDRFKTQIGSGKEYHARHILVDKEDDAKAIIAKLKDGAKFEELAKQSKDPGTAANGGDLDWMVPAALDKSFADAMVALQKGQITETPVKTQYGYHVIKLEDVRTAKVPTMEELTPQIKEAVLQQKLQAYQQELRKKAKVQ